MTPTPEPSPSVSVSRELLESLVMDIRNAAACLDVSSALTRQAVHGALDTAVAVQAEIDAALTQPQPEAPAPASPAERWIPVEERLPEDGQRILFSDIGGGIHAGRRCSDGWDEPVDFWDEGEITHWRELPRPPEAPNHVEYSK